MPVAAVPIAAGPIESVRRPGCRHAGREDSRRDRHLVPTDHCFPRFTNLSAGFPRTRGGRGIRLSSASSRRSASSWFDNKNTVISVKLSARAWKILDTSAISAAPVAVFLALTKPRWGYRRYAGGFRRGLGRSRPCDGGRADINEHDRFNLKRSCSKVWSATLRILQRDQQAARRRHIVLVIHSAPRVHVDGAAG